jgi:gentisate 1,2-dioxygenase
VERVTTGEVVIRGAERPVEINRQGHIKRYLQPRVYPNTALTDWVVLIHDVQRQSGKHRHQGGLVIYVLKGEGTTEVDGLRLDWQAGDVLLLPIQPDGVAHRHFNRSPSGPAQWMAFEYLPFSTYLMNAITQVEEMPARQDGAAATLSGLGSAAERVRRYGARRVDYQPAYVGSPAELADVDLWAELYKLRDHQRRVREAASWLVRGEDLPWQTNAQGIMRWYLHPCIGYVCLHTMLFYVQRIPPGSRSGCQRHGGNVVFYVLNGRGHTVLDGFRHTWEAGDLMTLPNRPQGVTYQHFNDDPERDVYIVACEPCMAYTIDLDRGGGFEQLEACPEYRAAR